MMETHGVEEMGLGYGEVRRGRPETEDGEEMGENKYEKEMNPYGEARLFALGSRRVGRDALRYIGETADFHLMNFSLKKLTQTGYSADM